MRKIIFSMAVLTATLFASCSKDAGIINDPIIDPTKGSVVKLSFVENAPTTRAFFDDNATAETWERNLTSVTIFAFDTHSDELIVRRDFNASEMADKSSTFALPGTSAGDNVDITVVANCEIPQSIVTASALRGVINSNLAEYNGTFGDISNSAKRSKGFVMTSQNDVVVASGTTTINAVLERTVAKVAVEMSLADNFDERYSGGVRVENITISNTPSQSTLHSSFEFANAPAKDYSFTQDANNTSEKFQNLFYIYESAAPALDTDKVLLTIEALYDMDGDFVGTTDDQTPLIYTLPLEDNDIPQVDRNSYYRISGKINGLSGSDASISITVSDWTTLTNKDVTLGN